MKTNINSDGSGIRTTLYHIEGEKAKEELGSKYILPVDGVWTESELKTDDKWFKKTKVYTYTVERKFKNINDFSSDYIRAGIYPTNVSKNKIGLNIKRHFFYMIYTYKEVFSDIAEKDKVSSLIIKEYNNYRDILCKQVKEKFLIEDEADLKNVLDNKYRPLLDEIIDGLVSYGYEYLSKNKEKFENESLENEMMNLLVNYISNKKSDLVKDKNQLLIQLKELFKEIDKELSNRFAELSGRNFDDILGVYGYPLFEQFEFLSSISLPGRIVETNSKDIKGNTANWKFNNEDFFLRNYTIFIRSKKTNYINVIIAIATPIFAIYAVYLILKKRKNEK